MRKQLIDVVITIQGIYYLITAVWSIIHLPSFLAVVGPKPDLFQFYTTTLLILIIAITLLLSVGREKSRSILFLALSSPVVFMLVEYYWREEIRSVFFFDFVVEAIIFISLAALLLRKK